MDRHGRPRDMVYCHECDNEWYRDEHGLTCPECQSDFTEIIEPMHDPRDEQVAFDDEEMPPLEHNHPLHDHNPWDHDSGAPDPDEEDIDQYGLQGAGPGRTMTFHGTFTRNVTTTTGSGAAPQPNSTGNPLMDSFAQMMGSILGGGPPPNAHPQTGPNTGARSPFNQAGRLQTTPGTRLGQGAATAPGVRINTGGGPGFAWTTTTQFNAGNAHGAPPQGQAFDDFPNLLQQILGGHPGMPAAGMPGQQGRSQPAGGPFADMGPLGGLFAGLFNPANMQHGDAVYSQEALDRIVSQLMEQNQTGNAPGPASAEAISSLPQKSITEADLGTEGKAECSICMDEVNIGEKVTLLPCGHWFHHECVKAWLSEHDTCPQCRSGIMPKNEPANSQRSRRADETPRNEQTWGPQGEGTRDDPFTLPESPPQPRGGSAGMRGGSSAPGPSNADRSSSTGDDGLFSRMRNAFGSGGS